MKDMIPRIEYFVGGGRGRGEREGREGGWRGRGGKSAGRGGTAAESLPYRSIFSVMILFRPLILM
jgi:hypothetical protein